MLRSLRLSSIPAAMAVRVSRLPLVSVAAVARKKAVILPERRKSVAFSPSTRPLLVLNVARRASTNDNETPSSPPSSSSSSSSPSSSVDLLGSLAALALWAAFVVYALKLSPNQTPARDLYLLQKLIPGAGAADDGVAVNGVFSALFNAMGVMPALYASVLIPAARSGGGKGTGGSAKAGPLLPPRLPAWPFVAGSFAFGFFALGPYLALWTPAPPVASEEERGGPRDATAPPLPEALEKNGALGGVFLRALESPLTAAVLFVAAAAQAFVAATAGKEQWAEFLRLFDESRFVHVTTLDFATLSLLLPFWAANDAAARGFDGGKGGAGKLAAAMASVPLVGPALYLVLRPKAQWKKKEEEGEGQE